MGNRRSAGHLAALLTIIIWGTTFISTKVLLTDFKPVEILFFRFVMGFSALFLVCPHRMKGVGRGQELTFVLAGLCGICLYYLLENIALTYTMASNVGVINSVAPFFTAILSRLFLKSEGKLRANFFIGFMVAMVGVALISFNGSKLELNPMGDLLAVLTAFVWACYLLPRSAGQFLPAGKGFLNVYILRRGKHTPYPLQGAGHPLSLRSPVCQVFHRRKLYGQQSHLPGWLCCRLH